MSTRNRINGASARGGFHKRMPPEAAGGKVLNLNGARQEVAEALTTLNKARVLKANVEGAIKEIGDVIARIPADRTDALEAAKDYEARLVGGLEGVKDLHVNAVLNARAVLCASFQGEIETLRERLGIKPDDEAAASPAPPTSEPEAK